ncbi:MAG: response regulator [Candidatus Cloacimonetes bacterium HGW-Cloacimonetes-1]|jgi:CheY-like chemotaxis protein|nr:MAG: response regulator [Candidatus Cloacimonetes bacterium HGW-Cloacimonetes-1]
MNYTLLIIEDNVDNYYLMKFLLEKSGYSVIGASTGIEGIEMALQHQPHGILLDIQLPEMNGYVVANKLKTQLETKHIPIIAVTSYAMFGDREKIIAAGASAYMEKPIDPESFVSDVIGYLSRENR